MISIWKCCAWCLVSLALMATVLIGGEPSKTTKVRSAKRSVSQILEADSDEYLFDTHLISREEELVEEQAPPATPDPRCCDKFHPWSNQRPFDSSANQSSNAPGTNPNAPSNSAMPNDSSFGNLAAGPGVLTAQNDVPGFIGDFFGAGGFQQIPILFEDGGIFYPSSSSLALPGGGLGAAPGANVGRMKLAENTSPLPRDRVFINYSYFDNTPLFPGGVNVNRVTPGFEKTFFDRNMSFELRAPFAQTLGNTIGQNGFGGTGLVSSNEAEWGNLTMYLKALLWSSDQFALSAGLGVAVPTADDFLLKDTNTGATMLRVKNQSTRLLPFVGGVYTPSDRFFAQGMLQFDVDVSGNPVQIQDPGSQDSSLFSLGRAHDATWLFADISAGYWVFRDSESDRWITGIAPIGELHFNTTLSRADGAIGTAGTSTIAIPNGPSVQFVNTTVGVNFLLRDQASVVLGYSTPLGGSDQQFDGELRVVFNWYFGGLNRQRRVQF